MLITDGPVHLLPGRRAWSDADVAGNFRVIDVPFVTVGGGLGSLAVVQFLRLAGVPAASIAVLGRTAWPDETFRTRAEASQLTADDPLRSASDATPDNAWGFPGYAVRRALRSRRLRPLWQVVAEPVAGEYFIPNGHQVYRSVRREAERLGWPDMVHRGTTLAVRRRAEGGYFILHRPDAAGSELVLYRGPYVHLATGMSAPRLLPDVRAFRARYPECRRVVHAYEPHAHIYDDLCRSPRTVAVRGAGIAASRILQRLCDDRRQGAGTRIVHLVRTPADRPSGARTVGRLAVRRDGGDGFSYQPFNFPKAAFGGQLKARLENLDPAARTHLLVAMGGTSTPRRAHWQRQLRAARAEGWYRTIVGTATLTGLDPDGRLRFALQAESDAVPVDLTADILIDATGLDGNITANPLLRDLVDCLGAEINDMGRLAVDPTFALCGAGDGLYASGAITYGGQYAPVDSFLGLQYAALTICDDLARRGFCRRIGVRQSVRQWWRWVRNASP